MKLFGCFALFITLGFCSCTFSCPDPEDILPCTCSHNVGYGTTYIDCDDATSESEIEDAFLAPFPVKDLYE